MVREQPLLKTGAWARRLTDAMTKGEAIKPQYFSAFSIGAGVAVALLVLNVGLTYRNTRQLHDDATWVAHTHEVMMGLANVLSLAKDGVETTSLAGHVSTAIGDGSDGVRTANATVGDDSGKPPCLSSRDRHRRDLHEPASISLP